MTKILIADDEFRIRELIKKYAHLDNYEIYEASDGFEAVSSVKENKPDIVIMDIMMPELDGFSAVREIRKFSDVPVIMLSARGDEYDRIHGFREGVDDYVVKPFSPKELMLRISAILKRYNHSAAEEETGNEVFEYENLKVDFDARLLFINGERTDLSPKEYDLLFYFIRNRDIALSREKLIREVWGYDFYGDDRTLDTHIKLLRKHLGEYSRMIVTLRSMGYRFETKI